MCEVVILLVEPEIRFLQSLVLSLWKQKTTNTYYTQDLSGQFSSMQQKQFHSYSAQNITIVCKNKTVFNLGYLRYYSYFITAYIIFFLQVQ